MDVRIKVVCAIIITVFLSIAVISYRVGYHDKQLFWLEQDVQRLKRQHQVNMDIVRYDTLRIDTMFVIVSKPPRTNYIMVQDSIMTKLYGSKWKSKLQ